MKKKVPVIEIHLCTKCGGCVEVAPSIFQFNETADYVEVIDQEVYSQKEVDEAIKMCPENCIKWEWIL